MLTSEIHAMQAKGYGLRAIEELLRENSVVVTAAEDAHASSGDDDDDCDGDSASRRRGRSAVCIRAEGGHERHLKVQRSVGHEMTAESTKEVLARARLAW